MGSYGLCLLELVCAGLLPPVHGMIDNCEAMRGDPGAGHAEKLNGRPNMNRITSPQSSDNVGSIMLPARSNDARITRPDFQLSAPSPSSAS